MESKAGVKVLSDVEMESSRDFTKAVSTSYKIQKKGLLGKFDTGQDFDGRHNFGIR